MQDLMLYIVFVPLALLGLAALLGSGMSSKHIASRALTLHQSLEAVWQVVTDFAAQPAWRKSLQEVVRIDEAVGQELWKEVPCRGSAISLQTMESQAPRRLVRRIADTNLPFGGRWIYDLTAVTEGCRLTITEEGEIYNPVFRFIGHRFINLGATVESYLKDLRQHFGEAGPIETVSQEDGV